MWQEIITAILILSGLGLVFGVVLSTATRKFRVIEDPRIDRVEEMLPGSNCGACGHPGCRAFAEAVISGDTQASCCTVSPAEKIEAIATYLGVEAGFNEKRVARLLCAGGHIEAPKRLNYKGLESCRAESVVTGGNKDCTFGCLGLGDCARACLFKAITMNENGLPVVDVEKCTACGDCVIACPKNLFIIMPLSHKLLVQCRSTLEGEEATGHCSVACTGCGLCATDSGGLITMKNNLPAIDYEKNEQLSPLPCRRCPTSAIVWVDGAQFQEDKKPLLPLGRVEMFRYTEDLNHEA
jgi:Na+-translocating ferredoxin:NAD+ oxidoreductase RNF subunit RnfB